LDEIILCHDGRQFLLASAGTAGGARPNISSIFDLMNASCFTSIEDSELPGRSGAGAP
jgi:hypothetical protein